MSNYFYRGNFKKYSNSVYIHDGRVMLNEMYHSDRKKTTVFFSHKHSDLEELRQIIGFLEKEYDIDGYIDSKDRDMPNHISEETALRLKTKIKMYEKFILLATNDAIKSCWCNWELGLGDAYKYKDNIAIFPVNDFGSEYKGNEYLEIYPHIVERKSGDKYNDGTQIIPGYYVRYKYENNYRLIELSKWLKGGELHG